MSKLAIFGGKCRTRDIGGVEMTPEEEIKLLKKEIKEINSSIPLIDRIFSSDNILIMLWGILFLYFIIMFIIYF